MNAEAKETQRKTQKVLCRGELCVTDTLFFIFTSALQTECLNLIRLATGAGCPMLT